jgi:3-deoxy-D-manno-octulosonic-acid transferase
VARSRLAERLPKGARARLAPVDIHSFVCRALDAEQPSCLIFVETEIWPEWIGEAAKRSVPTAFVSARLSERSFPRYRRLRPALRPLLERVAVIGCRTEEDRRRWIEIGAPPERCIAWGNTKYALGDPPKPLPPAKGGEPFLIVCGSMREGEEAILDLPASFRPGEVRLLLVVRHLRSVPNWERACLRRGVGFRRLSALEIVEEGTPAALATALRREETGMPTVILVDRIGILNDLYRIADAAFVGGTWVPVGGHNLFEPAREGVPVFFGPSIEGVRDAAEVLLERGGGRCTPDLSALVGEINALRSHEEHRRRMGAAACEAAEALAGSVERTLCGLRERGFPPEVAL